MPTPEQNESTITQQGTNYHLYQFGSKKMTPEELFLIGVRYARGYNSERDPVRAAEYYQMAAELNYVPAQFKLANVFERGRGVKQDFKQAAYWFRRAADNGHILAQCHLGLIYAKGRGVIRSNEDALYWYKKAAEQGNSTAQNNLALMYEYGFGCKKNLEEAAHWYSSAAQKGNINAAHALERIRIKKTPFLTRLWYSLFTSNKPQATPPEDKQAAPQHQINTTA